MFELFEPLYMTLNELAVTQSTWWPLKMITSKFLTYLCKIIFISVYATHTRIDVYLRTKTF